MNLIEIVEKKGIIASIIGFILALPVNAYTIYLFFADKGLSENQIDIFIWVNIVAWIWVILPSSITITGPKFTLEIKD